MNINDAFPSTYLKTADLQGKTVSVTISDCKMEQLGEEFKPVLFFAGTDKGMVLNKTNGMALSAAFGADTTDWVGKKIELFSMPVQYQGQIVDGLRIKAQTSSADFQAPQAPQAPQPQAPAGEPLNDDLPF